MANVYQFPADDLYTELQAALKSVIISMPDFIEPAEPFTATPGAAKKVTLPHVGIVSSSLIIPTSAGEYKKQFVSSKGLSSDIVFNQVVNTPVEIEYSHYTTYFIGDVFDMPFDVFEYLGDPNAAAKTERKIPVCSILLDPIKVSRRMGGGMGASVSGDFVLIGNAASGGTKTIHTEASKLYRACIEYRRDFEIAGLNHFLVDPPEFNSVWDTGSYEASVPFSCSVQLC